MIDIISPCRFCETYLSFWIPSILDFNWLINHRLFPSVPCISSLLLTPCENRFYWYNKVNFLFLLTHLFWKEYQSTSFSHSFIFQNGIIRTWFEQVSWFHAMYLITQGTCFIYKIISWVQNCFKIETEMSLLYFSSSLSSNPSFICVGYVLGNVFPLLYINLHHHCSLIIRSVVLQGLWY